jgi:glycosyltransferase involved in cell wall biosynthesis
MVARCLNTDHMRGMGKYVYELIDHAKGDPSLSWQLYADDPRHGMITPPGARLQADVFPYRGDRFSAWEQLGLPLKVRQAPLDLLHCTEGKLPLWQPKPTVVTVHDTLAWEERPDTPFYRFYWDHLQPAALKKCAHVVTISECSRSDILKRWPWLENKLTVIPHGIDEAYFSGEQSGVPARLAEQLAGAPYAVYLGGPMKRKRADWALDVIAACRQPGLKLVMCGFGSDARAGAAAALPPELRERVVFAEFLSDADLRALYRGARVVLYPTLYEGFGFPALEAQAAGTYVIFSALGSLSELIGPLALVVPPHDREAWVAAIDEACMMDQRRAERVAAAAQWVRQFRWAESFARHLEVYRQVASAT